MDMPHAMADTYVRRIGISRPQLCPHPAASLGL